MWNKKNKNKLQYFYVQYVYVIFKGLSNLNATLCWLDGSTKIIYNSYLSKYLEFLMFIQPKCHLFPLWHAESRCIHRSEI